MKSPLLVVALAALLTSPHLTAQVANPDARVSLNVEGRELSEVVSFLRDRSGANIVVLQGGDAEVSLELADVSWRDALELAAELAGCVVEERTAGVLVLDRPPRVTFAFTNAEVTEVIDAIAKISGANIVVAPEVAGLLSLRLTDVPWRDALMVAVKTLGYTIVEEDRGILRVVDPVSLQAQLETRSYQFRYIRPRNIYAPIIQSEFVIGQATPSSGDLALDFPVINALRKALSPGGDLDYVGQQNMIIVRDTAQVHAEIKTMLERLDVEPAQVFIDVKFVTTTNDDLLNLGVDYGDNGPQVGFSGSQIPITFPFNLGSGGFEDELIANVDPNDGLQSGPFVSGNQSDTLIPSTIFGALDFTQVFATFRAFQRDTNTEVVQAPKLTTLDGEEATIFVGETIRYAEARSEQGQAGGLQLTVQEAGGSPVEIGFQLLVIPHVIPGTDKMTMEVIPKETSLSGTGDSALAPSGFDIFTVGSGGSAGSIALPRVRSSTIVTSMLVKSGQTVVVGGLTTDVVFEQESRIPFLGAIPILGQLFKHREKNSERRTLLVFITPIVVRTNQDMEMILQRELDGRRDDYSEELQRLITGEVATPEEDHAVMSEVVAPAPTYYEGDLETFVEVPDDAQGE